jgi:hypothetical protein
MNQFSGIGIVSLEFSGPRLSMVKLFDGQFDPYFTLKKFGARPALRRRLAPKQEQGRRGLGGFAESI